VPFKNALKILPLQQNHLNSCDPLWFFLPVGSDVIPRENHAPEGEFRHIFVKRAGENDSRMEFSCKICMILRNNSVKHAIVFIYVNGAKRRVRCSVSNQYIIHAMVY